MIEANHYGISYTVRPLTRENYRAVLGALLDRGDFVLNLSVDVGSASIADLCIERGAMYLDTGIEPWAGGYTDPAVSPSRRSNYGQREDMLALKKNAVKECESCHTSGSAFFNTVTVAIAKADGRLKEFKARPEVLGSVISLASLKQFYVLGSTRLKILDWIGVLMVFGGASLPIAHLTLRILTSPIREAGRLNKMRKGDKR